MVLSIGLSAQTIDNTTACNYELRVHIQTIGSGCGPSLGFMNVSVNPGMSTLPTLPPGYEFFAVEVLDPGFTFLVGVGSGCSTCGVPTSSGSYPCTVSGNVTADWSICGTLKITN